MTAMVVLGFYESLTFAVIAALGRPPSFFCVLISVQAAGSILGGLATAPLIRRTGEARTLGAGHAAWSAARLVYTIGSVPAACTALAPLYAAALGTTSQRLPEASGQDRRGQHHAHEPLPDPVHRGRCRPHHRRLATGCCWSSSPRSPLRTPCPPAGQRVPGDPLPPDDRWTQTG
jgi:hypothetical protein